MLHKLMGLKVLTLRTPMFVITRIRLIITRIRLKTTKIRLIITMLKTDDQHDEINDHGEGLNNDDLDDRGDVDNQEGIYQNVIISIFLLQS